MRVCKDMLRQLLVICCLCLLQSGAGSAALTASVGDCLTNSLDSSLYCRGSRAMRNIIKNLNKSDKPVVLVRGLEIVRSSKDNETAPNAATDADADADDSFLGLVSAYLRTHELNLKFSDLLADESEQHYLANDLERNGVGAAIRFGSYSDSFGTSIGAGAGSAGAGVGAEEARKKDKGQSMLLAMALMFGKMMAVLGLGGIGALALKALGVAMAALMMAGLVGLKSLAQHGHENTHSISYLTAEGHHHKRRRRSMKLATREAQPLVYPAWNTDAKGI